MYLDKEGVISPLMQRSHKRLCVHCLDQLVELCAADGHQHMPWHLLCTLCLLRYLLRLRLY